MHITSRFVYMKPVLGLLVCEWIALCGILFFGPINLFLTHRFRLSALFIFYSLLFLLGFLFFSVSLLTIYEMLKATDRGMLISEIKLLEKSGGQSGLWQAG